MNPSGILDEARVYDGFDSLSGGMDAGRRPDAIGENQCASSSNVVFRGGLPSSRPPFLDLTHSFDNQHYYRVDGAYDSGSPVDPTSISTQTAFETGIFQGAAYYAPGSQAESIIAMIGGRLFRILPEANRIIHITEIKMDRRNTVIRDMAYLTQADRFMIVQDGESRPIIFDGVGARRAADNEVPVGTLMAYGMGRLVVVSPNRHDIVFGDLYGSHADFIDPGESVLKFEETLFLNEGFAASINTTMGKIKALAFAPQQDSSTGDGELLAFAERGVQSFFLSIPREEWKASAFQRVTLLNVGGAGHRMIVSINGDVWFRAPDGWRSYRQARAEIRGWARLPMSTEIRPWMEADTQTLLEHGSAIHFDNRLVSTCTPQPNQGRTYHKGLVALDFDVLSAFGEATRPAWDGHWTKLKFVQLVSGTFTGIERAFSFALTLDGKNHLYELMRSGRKDFDGPISSELIGRSMTFRSPNGATMSFNEKELLMADLWIDHVSDPVTMTLDFKPDQLPDWVPWKILPEISPVGECGALTCGGCPTIRDGFFPRRTVGKPPDGCDELNTKRSYRRGFEFQPRLRWVGHASIRRLRLHAHVRPEDPKATC